MAVDPIRGAGLVAVLTLLAGCASTSPAPALRDVAREVESRSGHVLRAPLAGDDEAAIRREVDALLARDLTPEAAVQVALLASPSLRADLEEVAVSQADLVQAGLLRNPTFTIGRTAWEGEHIAPNLFASVEQGFVDVLTLPLRKRLAGAQLEATKLAVGDRVLSLAGEVREAYYRAVAAEQVLALRRLVEEAASTQAELATRQHEAGNTSDLALRVQQGLAAQARIDRARAEGEAQVLREALAVRMGKGGTRLRLPAKLPELPAREVDLAPLEARAVATRLDVASARRTVEAMRAALDLAETTRWVGTVDVTVEAGKLRSGRFAFGPSVALEIPLFDQRQAQIAKLRAHVRRAEREVEAVAQHVRADVRTAAVRVRTARAVSEEMMRTVVPLREDVVRLSQEQYDAMLLGVFQLLSAKQAELEAFRESVESLRDYWIARSDLERAAATRLGPVPTNPNPERSRSTP